MYMADLSEWEKKNRIRNGLPIELFGIDFYPITMKDYEEFLAIKNSILLRMTTLPPQYMAMPYISALWAMELDSVAQSGKTIGLFYSVIRLVGLSLRLDSEQTKNLMKNVYCNPQNPAELVKIVLKDKTNTPVDILPFNFNQIRSLIAELNGLELPDDSANPELVEAESVLNEKNTQKVEYSTDNLISSVAYLSGISDTEINNWTIRQFEQRRQAIERDKYFTLYSQAELGGMVKFPKGNPCPSWCFNAKKGLTVALKTMDEMSDKMQALGDLSQIAGGSKTN